MKYIIILKSNEENLDIKFSLLNIVAIQICDKSNLYYFTNLYEEYWSTPKLHKINCVFFIYKKLKEETLYNYNTLSHYLKIVILTSSGPNILLTLRFGAPTIRIFLIPLKCNKLYANCAIS